MNWAVNHNNFGSLKFQAEQDLENEFPVIDFQYLKEIAELADKLLSVVILRRYSNNLEEPTVVIDEIMRLAYGIFHMAAFRSKDIQWIEELREKLFQKRARTHNQHNLCDATREKYNTILESRQLELKNILNHNSLSSGSTKRISVYKNDEKLQAVVEMLTLDIMSILAYYHKLENNDLFLDDNYPLLTGKCLRNYLAHDNVLVSLLANPSKMVLLNAIKLTGNALMTNNRKLGKLVSENPSKLRQKYNKNLQIISNQKRMFFAVEEGNKEELYECFKAGSDVKARNFTSWTSFHFAAKGRDVKILKFLHDQNPILDVKDINGQNPLHIAAAYGRTDNAKYLIEEGNICVSDKDIYLNSPIHIAAMKGHKKTFEFLLKNASEVEFMYDDLPLEFAIQNNHFEIVKFLLEENENCYKHKNRRGFVSLIEAAEGGHLEIVELLLQKNVDLNAKNKIRSTALHEAALSGHRAVVNVLVLEGADVDAQDVENYTPLHHAARYSHEEIVRILLNGGANANVYHKIDRHTPLHLASQFGSLPIVKNLLEYHANVNAELLDKTTPIHAAAISGHLDVVAFLCEHGANIKAERGYTPLFAAARSGQDKIAEFLIENSAKIDAKASEDLTPLHAAAMKNCKHTVKLLLEKKADIDARDIKGNSVLHLAVMNAEIDLIDFLIQNKAGVDNKNIVGCTPLHIAALRGRNDIVSTLVRNNAQINATSYWNSTPLHLAIDNGHLEVAHFLIENGAVINAERNCLVSTPLSLASIRNHMQIVDILISKGVDINEKDGEALYFAVEAGYSDMVQSLTEKNARIDFKYFNDNTLLHSAAIHGHKKKISCL